MRGEGPRLAGQVLAPKTRGHDPARLARRRPRHCRAVGAHEGDEADALAADIHPLVQRPRDPHGLAHAEAERARGLLQQRRRGEGRRRRAPHGAAREPLDVERPLADALRGPLRGGFAVEGKPVEPHPVEVAQPRRERAARPSRECGIDGPVLPRRECLDLALARADQPQRHRLQAARRAPALELAPQHPRESVAPQVVQHLPRPLRVHQVHVDGARARHRLAHRIGRDLVKDHPAHRRPADGVALAQPAGSTTTPGPTTRRRPLADGVPLAQPGQDLPGDRLAFTVGFGGEDQAVGRLERRRDRPQRPHRPLAGLRVDHGEIGVGIDRALLRRQLDHVAVAGEHAVPAAEPGPDRSCLGGRFDDHCMHETTSGVRPSSRSGAGAGHGTGRRIRNGERRAGRYRDPPAGIATRRPPEGPGARPRAVLWPGRGSPPACPPGSTG